MCEMELLFQSDELKPTTTSVFYVDEQSNFCQSSNVLTLCLSGQYQLTLTSNTATLRLYAVLPTNKTS